MGGVDSLPGLCYLGSSPKLVDAPPLVIRGLLANTCTPEWVYRFPFGELTTSPGGFFVPAVWG